MKTCLTCGALVADNADVCPDCGMELSPASSSASSPATPAVPAPPVATPAPADNSGANGGSGFTVDFGFDAAPPILPAPVASPDFGTSASDPFDFGNGDFNPANTGSTVAIDPISLEKTPAPTPPMPPMAPATPAHAAQILLKRAGAATGDVFTFGPGSIVGRFDPDSGPVDVDLAPLPEASYVSRHHAEFRYDAGQNAWFVRDMGSSNGTFWRAGGQGAFSRLAGEQAVQSGDEIALGNARFEFKTS